MAASIVGRILGAYSTTDTWAPKRRYTWPSSKPITPPPMTIRCLGISRRLKASVEVITRSLSIVIKGKAEGLEPVAMIKFFAESVSLSAPCTCSSTGETNDAFPWNTSTLFFFIRKLIPCVFWSTTACLRATIFGKSTLISPEISIPCMGACLWVSSSKWVESNSALEGIQPTLRQVPPSVLYFSTIAVFFPNWAQRIAAT